MRRITYLFIALLIAAFSWQGMAQVVTIGTGTSTQMQPLANYYGYERTADLYLANEISESGDIYTLAWNVDAIGATHPIKIFLATTNDAVLTSSSYDDFVTSINPTLVFDGQIVSTSNSGWVTFVLDSSFSYNGTDNLIVIVENNGGGFGPESSNATKVTYTSGHTNQHMFWRKDTTPPNASTTTTLDGNRSNIQLDFTEVTCIPPSILTTTSVSANTADIDWTAGDAETAWNISWGTPGYTPGDADEINTASVTTTDYQITGLTAQTDYDVFVQADCGAADGVSDWNGPVSLSTTQVPASLPYIDDFTTNQFSFVNGTQTNKWEYGSVAGNPSNAIYISNDGGTSNVYSTGSASVVQAYRDILVPADATTAEFSFDWRAKGEGFASYNFDYFRVWLVPSTYTLTPGTQITTNNDRIQIGGNFNDQDNWHSFSDNGLDISVFAGQTMRLVFEWRNDSSGGTQPPAAIDNIHLEIPSCPVPTALAATAMSATTADVEWSAGYAETAWNISWGTPGYTPGDGDEIDTATANATTYQITGLTEQTDFVVFVQADCGAVDGVSDWVGPYSFTTACAAIADMFEDFDSYGTGSVVPDCWERIAPAASAGSQTISSTSPASGNRNIYQTASSLQNPVIVALPEFDNVNAGTHWVRFKARVISGAPGILSVGYVTDINDYDSFILIEDLSITNTSYATDSEYTVVVPASVPSDARLSIKNASDGKSYYWDDIYWEEIPSCLWPTALVTTSVSATTADIEWTAGDDETSWIVTWGEPGYIPGETGKLGAVIVNDTSYQITGLTAQTDYDVFVQADCGEVDGVSEWVGPYNFTTTCATIADMFEDFDSYGTGSVVPDCWERIAPAASAGSQTISSTSPASGNRNIYQTASSSQNPVIVALPEFDNVNAGTHWVRFKARVSSGAPGILSVGYVTDINDYDSFILIEDLSITNTSYATDSEYTVVVPATVPSNARLAIKNTADAKSYFWDDVYWEENPSCLWPTALATTGITTTTADIEWTAGGAETEWEVLYGETGFDPVTQGTTVTVNNDPETTLSGLMHSTMYEFYVRAICAVDDLSSWTGPESFATACVSINTFPFVETFEDDSESFICWTQEHVSGTQDWYLTNGGGSGVSSAYNGSSNAIFRHGADNGSTTKLISPAFDFSNQNQMNLKFWYSNQVWVSSQSELRVYYRTSSNGAWNLIPGAEFTSSVNSWTEKEFVLPNAANASEYYVAFEGVNQWSYGITLDDITIYAEPTCPAPTDLATTGATTTTANIEWTAGDAETAWNISWGTPGYTPGDGDEIDTISANATSYQITGLTAQTDYDVFVQADCGAVDGLSSWTGPLSITTLCRAISILPYTEDFDTYGTGSEAYPDCWERVTYVSGSSIWPSIVSYSSSPSSPNSLRFQSLTTSPTYAISPAFAEDINDLRVSFMLRREGDDSGTIDVGVMSDASDISTFELIATIDPSDDDFHEYVYDLNQVTLSGSDNFIAFRHNSNSNIYFYWLDDFEVDFIPSCPAPTDLAVDIASIGLDSVELSWTESGTAADWEVIYGPEGFDPEDTTEATTVPVTTTTYTLTGLDHSTEYEVYVRAVCDATDKSSLEGPIYFSTLCSVHSVPYSLTFEEGRNCVTRQNLGLGDDGWLYYLDDVAGFSGIFAGYHRHATHDADAWLYTAEIALEAGVDYQISYKYGNSTSTGKSEKMKVAYGVDNDAPAMTTVLADHPEVSGSTPNINIVYFDVPADGTYYFGFHAYSDADNWYLFLDDIEITEAPTCFAPTDLLASSATVDTADIEWTAGGTETSWSISWGTPGYTPGDGNEIDTAIASTASYQLTGLTANTHYDVYVQADCGATDGASVWIGPLSLFTAQIPAMLPYVDDFATNQFSFVNGTQTNKWAYGAAAGNPSNAIYISNDGGTSNAYSIGSASVVQAYRDILIPADAALAEFSFDWRAKGEGFISINWDYFRVWLVPATYIPTSGTQITSEDDRIQIGGNFNDQEEWVTFSDNELDISAFAGQTMRLVFEWRNDASGGTQPPAAIDNIHLNLLPCQAPTDLTVDVASIGLNSVDISWTPFSLGTETEWEVRYGETGFDLATEGETVTVTTNPEATLSNLMHSTTYDVYVRAVCATDDISEWSESTSFTTLCTPGTVPFFEGFEEEYSGNEVLAGCWSQSGTEWRTRNVSDTHGREARTGNSYISLSDYSNGWIFYPLELTSGKTYNLSFYARQDNTLGASVMASFGDSDTETAMTNEIIPSTTINSSAYEEFSGTFAPSSDGVYYIGINGTTNIIPWYITIDDISVDVICEPVIDVAVSNIALTTATVTWAPFALANDGYVVNVYEEGADITTATAVFAETINDSTTTTSTVTGLNLGTAYDVYVTSVCDATNDMTAISTVVTFTTAFCEAVTDLIVSATTETTATFTWTASASATEGYVVNVYEAGTTIIVATEILLDGNTTTVEITGLDPDSDFEVTVTSDCGFGETATTAPAPFSTEGCSAVTDVTATNIGHATATIEWTEAAIPAADGYIVEVYEAGADIETATPVFEGTALTGATSIEATGLWPDTDYDVYVTSDCGYDTATAVMETFTTEPVVCDAVTGLTITDETQTGATLSWTNSATAVEGYEVKVYDAGADISATPVFEATIAVGVTTVNITGLTATVDGANYDVYVTSKCGFEITETTAVETFTTLPVPCDPVMNVMISNITATSAVVSWDLAATAIDGYVVNVYETGTTTNPVATVPVNAAVGAVGISGLSGSTTTNPKHYDVYVTSKCDFGVTVSSDVVTFKTIDVLCDIVADVTISAVTQNGATVSWIDVVTAIDGYNVEVYESGTTNLVKVESVGTGVTTAVLTNLPASTTGTSYDIYVITKCGYNGATVKSDVETFTTLEVTCDTVIASVDAFTQTTALVSWSASGTAVGNFTIDVYLAGDDPLSDTPVVTGTASVSATDYLVTGLDPATSYEVYVTSECDLGVETTSDEVAFTTESCDAVTNVVVSNETQTTATVSWIASATASDGYVLTLYEEGTEVSTQTLPISATSFELTGLDSATTYEVMITSDCGEVTINSALVEFTTVSCDAATDIAISDITLTSATVSWTASATASDGYIVNVYEAGTTNQVTTETTTANDTFVTLTGLDAGTAYDVVVTSDCGEVTMDAAVVIFTTLACDAVTDIVVSAITQTTATVTWTASATASDGYEVNVYEAGTTNLVITETATASETSVDLTGLDTATAYDVVVTSDCGDVTVDSTSVSFTTMTCDAVVAIAYNITQTTATVLWTPSATAVEYIVTVSEGGTEVSSDTITGTSFNLTGLLPATTYEVIVTSDCGDVTVDSNLVTINTMSCDAATEVTIAAYTQTTATVTWTASATASDGYEVNVYEAGTTNLVTTVTASASDTSALITGLEADTAYDVVVTSDCGDVTMDSGLVSFTTLSCDAVTDIVVSEITLTTATVTWTGSATATEGYVVNVYEAGTTNLVITETATASVTSIDLTGLDAATAYDVVVTSDCDDVTVDSASVTFTTLACDAVTNIVVSEITLTTATVTWTGSATATDGYVVNVYEAGTTNLVTTETADAGETSVDLTGLDAATVYDVVVTSDCDDVTVDSALVTFTTLSCDAVAVAVYDITRTTATVIWTASATAVEYIVTVNGTEVSSDTVVGATTFDLTGLDPATEYEVIVTTDCGDVTIDSPVIVFTTLSCDPVTDVVVSDISVDTATISWTASDGAIDGYLVEVYEAGADTTIDDTVFSVTGGVGVTSVGVTGLDPLTTYDVYVTTGCGVPITATSDVVTFTTEDIASVKDFNFVNLEVYPNPVATDLYLSATRVIEEVQVYNTLGKLVMTRKFNNSEVRLDVSRLSTATYVLKVKVDGLIGTVRFVKK